MTNDATIVSGRRVAERYRLVDPRGTGAWTAVDETLRRQVVVHLLPGDAPQAAKDHFTAEARSLARLNHPNVIATYDTGVDGDGTSYRVDELPGGEPLDLETVDDDRRVAYAVQISQAVADAHDAGLAHGHLGSGSVLIGDGGRAQLRGLRLPADAEVDAVKRADVAALTDLIIGLAPPGASRLRDVAVRWRATPPTSARAMHVALAAIPDDVLANLPPPRFTPATGVPAVATVRRRNRMPLVAGIVVLVAAAVVVAVVLPATRSTTSFQGPVSPVRMTVKSFDPQAVPPTEDEADAHLVVDGNPATMWQTEHYRSAHFGNLKQGVGLILQSDTASEFASITIVSPSRNWTLEIYTADQPATALSGWGRALAAATVRNQSTTITLDAAQGHALLVWITDPGPARQVRIGEITVSGRVAK